MKSRKFHYYLASLSAKEIKGFRNWLACPLNNKKALFRDLFDYYLDVVYKSKEEISPESFFTEFWKGKPFDDIYLRRIMAPLLKQLLDYLAFLGYQQDPTNRDNYLLGELNRRGYVNYFESTYTKISARLSEKKYLGDDYFRHRFFQEKERTNYLLLNRKVKHQLVYTPSLERADQWYFFIKLKYTCASLNRAKIFKLHSNQELIIPLIDHLIKTETHQPPMIQIYLNIYFMLIGKMKEQAYLKLKNLIAFHERTIPREEIRNIYVFAINYIRRQIKKGKPLEVELLTLYRQQLDSGVLLVNGKLPLLHYKNITTEMAKAGMADEAISLIKKYRYQLLNDPEGNTHYLCLAIVKFYHNEFKEAKEHLFHFIPLASKMKEVFLLLSARKLLCQVWFEMAGNNDNIYNLLENEIPSFISFAGRKDFLAPQKRKEALQFGRFMKRLFHVLRINPAKEKKTLFRLKSEIFGIANLEDRKWFEEKLRALSANNE